MRHSLPQSHQFYVTAPQPCPYLPGKVERKLFTALQGDGACHLNDVLSHQGFRRSQNVLYRPSCAGCAACLSARIVVSGFAPTRGQRRVLRRNAALERVTRSPWATETQYALFRRYLDARHATGGMADMDMGEFAAMIEESPVRSRVIEYYRPAPVASGRQLAAVCLTDFLSDGVSMVYSFFDPDLQASSLGSFIILDHIAIAAEAQLPYVYLGYWVPGSAKMNYKARFQPLEIFADGRWALLSELDATALSRRRGDRTAISEQVAAIELPSTR
jgi:arginyl-tRNA--protein-N-Asp/Glu arginylyltransferase